MNRVNPFTWGYDEFDRFESIPNQFNATYREVPDNVFDKTEREVFFNEDTILVSPNIAAVCDMDSICDADLAIV